MIYLKTQFVTIIKDTELNCLIIRWNGLCTSKQYRRVKLMAAEIVRKEKIRHWISDNTDARVIAMSDHDWLFENLIVNGSRFLHSIHIVQSRNIFRNIAMQKLIEQSRQIGVKIHRFSSLEEAKENIRNKAYSTENKKETSDWLAAI